MKLKQYSLTGTNWEHNGVKFKTTVTLTVPRNCSTLSTKWKKIFFEVFILVSENFSYQLMTAAIQVSWNKIAYMNNLYWIPVNTNIYGSHFSLQTWELLLQFSLLKMFGTRLDMMQMKIMKSINRFGVEGRDKKKYGQNHLTPNWRERPAIVQLSTSQS